MLMEELNNFHFQLYNCIFSSQPNEVGHDITLHNCEIIQYTFFLTRSVARKTLLRTFLWASNSKFAIFPESSLCSNFGNFGVWCPNLCLNTWEIYHSSVSYTGVLWTQGDPTLQKIAHCALQCIGWAGVDRQICEMQPSGKPLIYFPLCFPNWCKNKYFMDDSCNLK